jgi:hypothetical protein
MGPLIGLWFAQQHQNFHIMLKIKYKRLERSAVLNKWAEIDNAELRLDALMNNGTACR